MNSSMCARLAGWIDEGATVVGKSIGDSADGVRAAADHVADDPVLGHARDVLHHAAGAIESVGAYFQAADAAKLRADVAYFGRERPIATAVGGFLLGVGAARLWKAGVARGLRRELTPRNLLRIARDAAAR